MFTAKSVAKKLGVLVGRKLAFEEGDDVLDGQVTVDDKVHVQVGATYLVVARWTDRETLLSWPMRTKVNFAGCDLLEATQGILPKGLR